MEIQVIDNMRYFSKLHEKCNILHSELKTDRALPTEKGEP
jgi:hypothetical protein